MLRPEFQKIVDDENIIWQFDVDSSAYQAMVRFAQRCQDLADNPKELTDE